MKTKYNIVSKQKTKNACKKLLGKKYVQLYATVFEKNIWKNV